MNCAHENQRFKDAVNQYTHKRLEQVAANYPGNPLDNIDPRFCARHDDAVIYREWLKGFTRNDSEEVESMCGELSTVSEINYQIIEYYEQQRSDEMERQILILKDEELRNGVMRA